MGEPRTGTVTVLFTDLIGSTELMVRLGALAYDDLRTAHFGALRRAVEDGRGTEIQGHRRRDPGHVQVGFPWGCIAHHAAIAATAAGRWEEAAALFDEAEAVHIRLGAGFMAERTRIERARARI